MMNQRGRGRGRGRAGRGGADDAASSREPLSAAAALYNPDISTITYERDSRTFGQCLVFVLFEKNKVGWVGLIVCGRKEGRKPAPVSFSC